MQIPKYFYFRIKTDRKGLTLEIEDASDTDVAEVVRCRERDIGMCYSDGSVQCEWSNGFYADDYCPRGKRKGGDET